MTEHGKTVDLHVGRAYFHARQGRCAVCAATPHTVIVCVRFEERTELRLCEACAVALHRKLGERLDAPLCGQ
jgi:hypothetical protein